MAQPNQDVLFVVEISVSGKQVAPLSVGKTDDCAVLATEFAHKHNLNESQIPKLTNEIEELRRQYLLQQIPHTSELESKDDLPTQDTSLSCGSDENIEQQFLSNIAIKTPAKEIDQNNDEVEEDYISSSTSTSDILVNAVEEDTNGAEEDRSTSNTVQDADTPTDSCELIVDTTQDSLFKEFFDAHSQQALPRSDNNNGPHPKVKPQNKKNLQELEWVDETNIASVDNLAKKTIHMKSRESRFEMLYKNGIYEIKFFSILLQIKLNALQEQKRRHDLKHIKEECSFKPQISSSARTLKRDGSKVWKRIVDPMGTNKTKQLEKLREIWLVSFFDCYFNQTKSYNKTLAHIFQESNKIKEQQECTFSPQISKRTKMLALCKEIKHDTAQKNVWERLCIPLSEKPPAANIQKRTHAKTAPPIEKAHSTNNMLFERLYEEHKRLLQKKDGTFKHPDETDLTFHPKLICNYKSKSKTKEHDNVKKNHKSFGDRLHQSRSHNTIHHSHVSNIFLFIAYLHIIHFFVVVKTIIMEVALKTKIFIRNKSLFVNLFYENIVQMRVYTPVLESVSHNFCARQIFQSEELIMRHRVSQIVDVHENVLSSSGRRIKTCGKKKGGKSCPSRYHVNKSFQLNLTKKINNEGKKEEKKKKNSIFL
ncbi:hypothetical protein RFI_07157 [Reticulomyxa filosa]|uniref:Uncharacterized protein n=1 Tax=Reticulomyxa filosa TaxID=46433 RepID=X6NVW3_RETFI|nr:hypothetical protein RFI_07157 [Reticulomyxa filosa]|eukprot:ETO29964.1 hypothetical protein RFI_07157 [Reticulomyxa filosa]